MTGNLQLTNFFHFDFKIVFYDLVGFYDVECVAN